MTQLVIHIGDCKSGSTAIQSVLQAGTYTVTGEGMPLHYCVAGRRDALNHHRLSNSLHMAQHKKYQEQAWGAFSEEFAENLGQKRMIISSERFEFVDPNLLYSKLATKIPKALGELKIVVYVRPHIERVVSGYAQNIKQGLFSGSLEEFLTVASEENRFAFAPRLKQWRSVFGENVVDFRPMIRSTLKSNCVVTDFLSTCLDEGQEATVDSIPNANASLTLPALGLLRDLWGMLDAGRNPKQNPQVGQVQAFSTALEHSGAIEGPKLTISRSLAERARTIYADDARECDVALFGAPVMTPALTKQVEKAPEEVPEMESSADAVAASKVWMDVMAQMRQNIMQQKQRGNQGRRSPTNAHWRGTQ